MPSDFARMLSTRCPFRGGSAGLDWGSLVNLGVGVKRIRTCRRWGRQTLVPAGARMGLLMLGLESRRGLELDVDCDGYFHLRTQKLRLHQLGEKVVGRSSSSGSGMTYPWVRCTSDNSSMGVMGGGGGNGGGDVISPSLNGDDGRFSIAKFERFGRCDRRVRGYVTLR